MTAQGSPVDISVVMPAYNEEESLPVLVDEIEKTLGPLGRAYEVVVVDDGSTDATREVMRGLAASKSFVRPLYFDRNYGQTSAFDAGIKAARGARIVLIDADGQNDPADIPRLLGELDRFDAAVGWRRERKDPWTKKLTSRFANAVRKMATGDTTHDTGCSLKAFRAECIKRVKLYNGMHRFLATLAALEGASITEVPVNHRPRRFGKSKYNIFNRAVRPALDLLAVMWMRRRRLTYGTKKED